MVRQGVSWWWVRGPQDVPCPRSPWAWLDGSARASPPGRFLGGGAYPPDPQLRGARAMLPPRPRGRHARSRQVRRQPRPAPGCGQWAPRARAPPDPSAGARDAQKPHSARPGQHRAPAGGPTRRVCLGRANGAIVPPPDPEAQLSSQPEGIRGCLGNGVAWWWRGQPCSGKKEAASRLTSFGSSGAPRTRWKVWPLLQSVPAGVHFLASDM